MKKTLLFLMVYAGAAFGQPKPSTVISEFEVFGGPGVSFSSNPVSTDFNPSIGVGYKFRSDRKYTFNEVIASYGYTYKGGHTALAGLKSNITLGNSPVGLFASSQAGTTTSVTKTNTITKFTYVSGGGITVSVSKKNAVVLGVAFNKIVDTPIYVSTGIGFSHTF